MTAPYAVSNRESNALPPQAERERSQISSITPADAPSEKQDRILNSLAARALEAMGATSVVIGLMRGHTVICRARAGQPLTNIGDPINGETGLTGMAIRRQMSQWCNDTESDGRVDIGACRQFGIRSIIAVPIHERDAVVGIFAIFSANPDAFSLADVNGVKGLAEQITEAIENTIGNPTSPTRAVAIADSKPARNQQPVIFSSAQVRKKRIGNYGARIWRALALVLLWDKNGRAS
jgi:hypothetical protein